MSNASFYADLMIVDAFSADPSLYKKAQQSGLLSSLVEKVKQYVSNHVDPNDKFGSLMNFLGPGVISAMFTGLGMPWIGRLLAFASSMFHFKFGDCIETIIKDIKSMLQSPNSTTSSEQIHNTVTSAVNANIGNNNQENSQTKASFDQKLRKAKFVRLAVDDFDKKSILLTSEPFISVAFPDVKNILVSVLSCIFSIIIAAFGFMITGDIANKLVNRPNALDGSLKDGKENLTQNTINTQISHQNKFHLKGDAPVPFMKSILNTPQNIDQILINFANDVYDGLQGKDAIIKQTPGFQELSHKIKFFNEAATGDMGIYFPSDISSQTKKQLVDTFIDDVAKAS